MADTHSITVAKKTIEEEIKKIEKALEQIGDIDEKKLKNKTKRLLEQKLAILEKAQAEQERIEAMEGSYTTKDLEEPKTNFRDKRIEKLDEKMVDAHDKSLAYKAAGQENKRYREAMKYKKLKNKKGKIEAKQRKIVNKKVLKKIHKTTKAEKEVIKNNKEAGREEYINKVGETREKVQNTFENAREKINSAKDKIKAAHGIKKALKIVTQGSKIVINGVIVAGSFLGAKTLGAYIAVLNGKNGIFKGATKVKNTIAEKIKEGYENLKEKGKGRSRGSSDSE